MPELRIGISGWTYSPWRGIFFPNDLIQKRELEFASRQVNAIEINGSFYSLQRPESYRRWYEQTPPDFMFSVKGPRYITHLKRLRDIEVPLANFFASGVLRLEDKLGPILWQFPPNFRFDPIRLTAFFELLPRTTRAAARLALGHNEKVDGRSWTTTDRDRPIRHVIEIRHPTFASREFVDLLRQQDIGLVVADTAGKWPFMEDITSDLIYVRLHGDEQLYVSGYTPESLDEWARKIRAWNRGRSPAGTRLVAPKPKPAPNGRSLYVFFDNDVKVRAPFDAMALARRLGIGPAPFEPLSPFSAVTEQPRTNWPSFPQRPPRKHRRLPVSRAS